MSHLRSLNPAGPFRYRRDLAVCLALTLLTVVTLGRVCVCDFVDYDDDVYVTQNLSVQGGLMPENLGWAFTSTKSNHWHPLTWISLQCDAELYGVHPFGFHLTNLVLHVANVLLLYAVLLRMTEATYGSAATAALFAVHPLHVESVAWVTERKDVLSTLFGLLTIAAYVRHARAPGWRRYALVALSYAAGLLAKSMLILLPAALLLLDWWPLRRFRAASQPADGRRPFAPAPPSRLVAEKVPLFALGVLAAVVGLAARQVDGGLKSGEYLSLAERLGVAANAAVVYLRKILWPSDLAPYYPLPVGGLSAWQVGGAAALLAVLTLLALRGHRRRPYLAVGWLWYLVTLVPVSGLVQLGSYAYADRYTYIPSIGLFVGLVWWVADLKPGDLRARVVAPAFSVIVLAAALLSWRQAGVWRDSVALWEHARRVTPDNYFARLHLGLVYQRVGRLEEAEAELAGAVKLRPEIGLVHDCLGEIQLQRGQPEEAESQFRLALILDPGKAGYRLHLVDALRRQGREAAAAEEFRALIGQVPEG
jgi:tetratricopeptide (TPR) repeat protein